jgi:class 3 adenylate cyclase
MVPALVTNSEVVWEHEFVTRCFDLLSKHLSVIAFDKRGIGLSDRTDVAPTLEERIGDIVSVMDAVGWERASLLGISEGGVMSQLFAATYPERVDKLILHNTAVPSRYYGRVATLVETDDPPIASIEQTWARFESLADGWPENSQEMVDWFMPDQSSNDAFVRWVGRLQRLSASPRDFRRQLEGILELDAGDAPERITAPTLVIHLKGDRVLPVAFGRTLGEIIPDARYLEVAGDDHFSWASPNWRDIVDPILEFLTGTMVERTPTRQFATVLFTDIVDSTRQAAAVGDTAWRATMDAHDRLARKLVERHAGRVVRSTGDGLLAVFDVPSQAASCGTAMVRELRGIGVDIRAGIHAGEIEVHDDLDISGIAVNLAARVEQAAHDGELWASSTMRDLMLGGAATFEDRGEHTLKGIDGAWRLFAVTSD